MGKRGRRPKTILLKDLAPRAEITGGAGKVVFGHPTVGLPHGPGKPADGKRSQRGH